MIDCKLDGREVERLVYRGSNLAIAIEICEIVNAIYSAVMKSDPRAAEIIKRSIMRGMLPDSPTWRANENIEGIFIA